jgi:AraC-like DNA-binding protein
LYRFGAARANGFYANWKAMTPQSETTPILKMVREQLIPWTEHGGERLLLARTARRDLKLPAGVGVSPAQVRGARVALRGPRRSQNASSLQIARWPEDGLETLRVPMLWCVLAGHADFRLGEYVLHCDAGHFLFIPPGVPHLYGARVALEGENRRRGSCDLLMLSPRGRQLHCWTARSRGEVFQSTRVGENIFVTEESLADYLDRIVAELQSERTDAGRIAHVLLLAFWLTMQRELQERRYLHIGSPAQAGSTPGANYDPIVHARQHMQSHLHENLTLESVAQTVYMSRTQFALRFKAQTGQTFVEFLTAQRLQQAERFLLETDWTIPYISRFVGFRSPSYFHRVFKRRTRMSPVEFRRKTER